MGKAGCVWGLLSAVSISGGCTTEMAKYMAYIFYGGNERKIPAEFEGLDHGGLKVYTTLDSSELIRRLPEFLEHSLLRYSQSIVPLPAPTTKLAEEVVSVPFVLPEGFPVPVVEVMLNGNGPWRLAVDTAMGGTILLRRE